MFSFNESHRLSFLDSGGVDGMNKLDEEVDASNGGVVSVDDRYASRDAANEDSELEVDALRLGLFFNLPSVVVVVVAAGVVVVVVEVEVDNVGAKPNNRRGGGGW